MMGRSSSSFESPYHQHDRRSRLRSARPATGASVVHTGRGAPRGDAQEQPHRHAGVDIRPAGGRGAWPTRRRRAACRRWPSPAPSTWRRTAPASTRWRRGRPNAANRCAAQQVVRDAILRATPIARYGQPHEVADVIAFMASDDARFVTGHDLVVDGGPTRAAILYDLAANPQATRGRRRFGLKRCAPARRRDNPSRSPDPRSAGARSAR